MSKMEVICVRLKLKPNKREKLEEWAKFLNDQIFEVRQTLKDEGVSIESVFLEETSEGDFLIYYMRAQNLEHARAVAKKSTHEVDKYHQATMKEIIDNRTRLRCLLDATPLCDEQSISGSPVGDC